jgi:2-dehydro-3-deoxygalactonokinase
VSSRISPDADIICIDCGTTNTRLWRVDPAGEIVHRSTAPVGVRDTARDGSNHKLKQSLKSLINAATTGRPASCIAAAGMITSSLGLMEIPHLPAPAGLDEIATAALPRQFPEISEVPVVLIPGLRSGSPSNARDLMRGEETLCLGLMELGWIDGRTTVLNLGSHWKSIDVDGRQIRSSVTTLSGEMIHAIQTGTILASALPAERPEAIDLSWFDRGRDECARHGLGRTLFTTRLLELQKQSSPDERYAYVLGAFVAADWKTLMDQDHGNRVLINGHPALAGGWQHALSLAGRESQALTPEQIEKATVGGMIAVARRK